jgi:RNA polymerase sigma factor (sigma-70 family)
MRGRGKGTAVRDATPTGPSIVEDLLADLPRLKGVARALAGNGPDAHDLLQATCLRVLEHVDRLEREGPGESRALFARIMRNLHLDGLRKRRPSSPIDREDLEAAQRPSIALWRQVSDEVVTRAASALSRPQREIWTLSYEHRLDHRQIASILRLRLGTVATRVHRARLGVRAHLRSALGHLGADLAD